MARVVKRHVFGNQAGSPYTEEYIIHVNTEGVFYTTVHHKFTADVKGTACRGGRTEKFRGNLKVFNGDMESLATHISMAIKAYYEPTVVRTIVIRYNLESHVKFAEDGDGNIYQNCSIGGPAKQAKWDLTDTRYGVHHASEPCDGGYSLTVGARVVYKDVKTYSNGKSVVCYEYFSGKGSEAAEQLNAWCSFSLPESAVEMEYSDKAAMFFHNMMLGMAKISKNIQDLAHDKDKLSHLIQSDNNIKLLG